MNKMLVVIDMQIKFINQIGAHHIVPKVVKKIKQKAEERCEILLTLDKCGGELNKEISDLCKGYVIFKKHSYGCEELMKYLKQKNPHKIEFVGICTDICVITNVLSSITFLPFADITVDSGCCAAESSEGHFCALKAMKACNINII